VSSLALLSRHMSEATGNQEPFSPPTVPYSLGEPASLKWSDCIRGIVNLMQPCNKFQWNGIRKVEPAIALLAWSCNMVYYCCS
jgi:hypothetical protein